MTEGELPSCDGSSFNRDLKNRTVQSGTLKVASHAVQFVIAMGSLMILARLLMPGDFGVMAMVMGFIGLTILVNDCGLIPASIQKRQLTR